MGTPTCKLYDDDVVHAIMTSTAIAVMDWLRENRDADEEDLCDFVEANADGIIADALADLEDEGEESEPDGNSR